MDRQTKSSDHQTDRMENGRSIAKIEVARKTGDWINREANSNNEDDNLKKISKEKFIGENVQKRLARYGSDRLNVGGT